MADYKNTYWEECVAQSLDAHGVTATEEQIKLIANDMVMGAEMQGQAFGWDAIPDPRVKELKNAQTNLQIEREKITCAECGGKGRLISYGGTFQCESECWKCHGEGKIHPRGLRTSDRY